MKYFLTTPAQFTEAFIVVIPLITSLQSFKLNDDFLAMSQK